MAAAGSVIVVMIVLNLETLFCPGTLSTRAHHDLLDKDPQFGFIVLNHCLAPRPLMVVMSETADAGVFVSLSFLIAHFPSKCTSRLLFSCREP